MEYSELSELQEDLCCNTCGILDDPLPSRTAGSSSRREPTGSHGVVVGKGFGGHSLFVAVHLDGKHDLRIGKVDVVALSADPDFMLVAVGRQPVTSWTDVEAELGTLSAGRSPIMIMSNARRATTTPVLPGLPKRRIVVATSATVNSFS